MYILIEGTDGSGKDTQADMLITRLTAAGQNPLRVAEPCEENPHGRLLRQLLASGEHRESHAALFLADRMALQAAQVKPAVDAGRPVVSVRSFLSTLVYQQENWPLDWLIDIHRQMLVKPDIVVWLDVNPEVGLERVGKRALAKEVYERLDIQQRNRRRYHDLLHPDGQHLDQLRELLAPGASIIVVNSDRPRDEVHADIWAGIPDGTL